MPSWSFQQATQPMLQYTKNRKEYDRTFSAWYRQNQTQTNNIYKKCKRYVHEYYDYLQDIHEISYVLGEINIQFSLFKMPYIPRH